MRMESRITARQLRGVIMRPRFSGDALIGKDVSGFSPDESNPALATRGKIRSTKRERRNDQSIAPEGAEPTERRRPRPARH